MSTTLVIIFVFTCVLVGSSSALQCMAGVDGQGQAPLRKIEYPALFQCCFKYADVLFPKFSVFGAVPPSLTKRACFQAGQCFFTKELNKNVCVCANADDPNCHSGPLTLTVKTATGPVSPK